MSLAVDGVFKVLEFLRYLDGWLSRDRCQRPLTYQGAPPREREYLVSWLASDRRLATCWCQDLDLPPGSTFGDAAKKVLEALYGPEVTAPPD